jgi:hypothetical protein
VRRRRPAERSAQRSAKRLLRWYPRSWRERYGDEFEELLLAEWAERPRSARRTVNVVASGLVARLSHAGLTGPVLDGPAQAHASLAAFVVALAAFLALGVSMWSQLTIGWQWSPPDAVATAVAVIGMTVMVGVFALLALGAAAPVAWVVIKAFRQRTAQGLGRPVGLIGSGLAVLIVGSRHFGNGWPGTGGHPWAHQGLVPGGIAAFSWASTLSISSYWLHPLALSAFPPAEVAWMIGSPVALIAIAVGAATVVRRVQLSQRALRFEVRLGRVTAAAMVLFVIAAACWVLEGGAGPHGLFTSGAIDRVGLIAMVAAVVLAVRALGRARTGPLLRPG